MARTTIESGVGRAAGAPAPPSPPALRLARPRWRDARLVAGVLLVLLAVVLGARTMASAARTTAVWAAARDLAVGTTLRPGDVVRHDVRLGSSASAYLSAAGGSPVGYVLSRPVTAGELLPAAAVTEASAAPDLRLVTVPVERFHRPGALRHGARVDVYVTVVTTSASPGTTRVVLTGATVDDVVSDGGRFGPTGDSVGVVLAVPPGEVSDLVAASRAGVLDLVASA